MNPTPLRSITIVGGGSAGWMTALYLNRYLNHDAPRCDITLVESEDIGIIGVGEATVHSIRFFFAAMGLDEAELMRECCATYKTGILFRNWMAPKEGSTHQYFHPFEEQRVPGVLDLASTWLSGGQTDQMRYDQAASLGSRLMQQGLGPKTPTSPPWQGVVPYGYHLDAVLMGRYLRKKAIEAGVGHVVGTVDRIEHEGERITALYCQQQRFQSDLFIDCSGFRRLLLSPLRQDNWQSFEDALPCNRAVALQLPYQPGVSPRPYTTATALENGWIWEIDLQNRRGNGYVYDGNRLTEAEAEARLREFLGEPEQGKAVHLKMNIGCVKSFWVGNCVAIGLSGGFIEPLESTGLHLINLSVRLLATHLNCAEPDQSSKDSYNRLMNGIYDDLKRFIVLHYCLTDRQDTPFWQQAQRSVDHTPVLAQQLELWRHKVCEFMDLAGSFSTVFTDENYRYVLYGMDHLPQLPPQGAPAACRAALDQLHQRFDQVTLQALPHAEQLPN